MSISQLYDAQISAAADSPLFWICSQQCSLLEPVHCASDSSTAAETLMMDTPRRARKVTFILDELTLTLMEQVYNMYVSVAT